MANTVYIAHFYPPEDAAAFFEQGSIIEVMGEVFGSYADAANQLSEELGDIMEADLPVGAYIIEAIDRPVGYEVVDFYDLADTGTTSRVSNPTKPKAKAERAEPSARSEKDNAARALERINKRKSGDKSAPKASTKEAKPAGSGKAAGSGKTTGKPAGSGKPATTEPTYKVGDKRKTRPIAERERVGEQIGQTDRAWLADLNGIDRGEYEEVVSTKDAASKYGSFVARFAPFPKVSARNLSGEIMRAVEGPARTQQKQVLAEAREQGKFDAAPAIVADIERGPSQIAASIAELVETVAEDRAKLKAAIKSDNTKAAAEAERNIAFGETRAQMLNLLQNFCPYYANTDEGKKAAKAVKGKVLTEEMASSVVGYSLIAEIEKREAALKIKKREEDKALAETARKDKAAKAAQEKAAKQPTTTNKKQAKKASAAAEAAAHAADAASAEADAAAARLAQAEAEAKAQAAEDAAPPTRSTRNTRNKRK